MGFTKIINAAIVAALLVGLPGCDVPVANTNSHGRTIVCLGASLTLGVGADKGKDYPSDLAAMVDWPVINAGINANTTRDELQRLQHDVLAFNPKIVIITQRANDLKKNIRKEETLKNLETMIDQIQGAGAMVVLVTFEPKVLKNVYFKDIEQMALRKHALLIPDILGGMQNDPHYMRDDVHPNNAGYMMVAQRVFKKIKAYLQH